MKTSENFYYAVVQEALGTLENRKAKIRGNQLQCCCPFHNDSKPSFGINLHTGLFNCLTCGEKGNIVQFLSKMTGITEYEAKKKIINEVGFVDITQIPYSLEEFSNEKKLPIEFLKQNHIDSLNGLHITFPYYDDSQNIIRIRYRNNPKSDKRFFWNTGDEIVLYGLWKLLSFDKDYIFLVEGETDSLSLWYHNIPALGVPGADTFKKEYAKIFENFDKVIVHMENDIGGKTFMKKICQSGIPFEKLYKICSANIDENCKDISDLHIKNILEEQTLLSKIQKIDKDYFDEVNRGKQASKEHVIIADKILEELYIKYYKENFYVYDSGVYKEGKSKIEKCIISIDKNIKKNVRTEILDYIRIIEGVEITNIDKNLINFKNGIYHIDTNTLEAHSPEIFTICQINAKYLNDDELNEVIKNKQNVYIDSFLADICCEHTYRIDTLLEFISYSMTYSVELAKCLFLVGETAGNGKSTFIKLLCNLFGEANYCSISIDEFSERFFGSELTNKLLNIIHEVKNISINDISKFKATISGDELSVEEKYKNRYKIKPFTHHIFAMNNLPELKNADEGFFRRLNIVPFERKFTEEEQEKFNFDDLITESSLNYLANIALRKYLKMRNEGRRKFSNYKESDELLNGYKIADNSAHIFLNDIILYARLLDSNNKVIVKNLYEEYSNWCESNSFEPFSKREFKNIALGSGIFKKSKMKNGYECFEYNKKFPNNINQQKDFENIVTSIPKRIFRNDRAF